MSTKIKDTEAQHTRLDQEEFAKNGRHNSPINTGPLQRADQTWALTPISVETLTKLEILFGVSQVILKRDGNIVMLLRKETRKAFGEKRAHNIEEYKPKQDLDWHVKVGQSKPLMNIAGLQIAIRMMDWIKTFAEIQDKVVIQSGASQLTQLKNGNIVIQLQKTLLQSNHYRVKKL